MPIVECGFPSGLFLPALPATTSSQATPAIALNGPDALAYRGPTILIDIGFDPALFGTSLPSIPGASTPPAAIPAVQVPALLDTGAGESSIDEQLAQQLQLPLIDKQTRVGIGGPTILNVYLAHIVIPGFVTQYGRFTGVHLQAGGQYHRALIGRSLLKDTVLIYDGRYGTVRLAR